MAEWTEPAVPERSVAERPPGVADAALALTNVMLETARIPVHLAFRLPGMKRLAAEGAMVRRRTRSRLEGVLEDVLSTPEFERALDRVLARAQLRTPTHPTTDHPHRMMQRDGGEGSV